MPSVKPAWRPLLLTLIGGVVGVACSGKVVVNDNGEVTCTDGIKNGDETSVDCGGPTCTTRCSVGQTCSGNSDCASGVCGSGGTCEVAPTCGNSLLDAGETCDGALLGGETCVTQGFGGGNLACNATCDGFVTTACDPCGNNTVNAGETCDGVDHNGEDCTTLGYVGGSLSCVLTCDAFDTSLCIGCGNDIAQGSEVCDGIDLRGQNCTDGGFTGGTLACSPTCDAYDTSACTGAGPTCGNATPEGFEQCDGSVAPTTCTDVDARFDGGTLACNSACTGPGDCTCTFDTSQCSDCGDNLRQGSELCDGTDVGATCADAGCTGGSMGCNATCDAYVTTGCTGCPGCGNDTREGFEVCDGTDVGGATCTSVNPTFDGGSLGCLPSCTGYDTSACTDCGNDLTETGETCDGSDVNGLFCTDFGYDSGTLGCLVSCTGYDTSSCVTSAVCGNATREGPEQCDAPDFGTVTSCTDIDPAFDGGTFSCVSTCAVPPGDCTCMFDTSQCTDCGNDLTESGETCDGADLTGATCQSVNAAYDGGTLACTSTCDAFDETGCYDCGDGMIDSPEVCDGANLGVETCASQDPLFTGGTLSCNSNCLSFNTTACTRCGDNIRQGSEVCDGTDVGGQDCTDFGFGGGTLTCLGNCTGYDTSGCGDFRIDDTQTFFANRSQGIRLVVSGAGFADSSGNALVTAYLLLSTQCATPGDAACVSGTSEGTSKLSFNECSGGAVPDCGVTPAAQCYTVTGDGSDDTLILHVCPNQVGTLTGGFYDVRLERTNPTPGAVARGKVLKFVESQAPTVTDVAPTSAYHGSATDGIISDQLVDVTGTGFIDTPQVELVNINTGQTYGAQAVQFAGPTALSGVVPSESQGMPVGSYWVRVTNPDGQSAFWLVDDGSGNLRRGLFRITNIPPPKITTINPARPSGGDFPFTLVVTGEAFQSGAVVYIELPTGASCATTSTFVSSTELTAPLGSGGDTPAGCTNLGQGVYPVKVVNPDGQFALYFSLQVYPNSAGHLSGAFTLLSSTLNEGRAFHGGVVGFDDLRSAFLYVAGGIACSGDCPKQGNLWDTGGVTLLRSVEVSRVSPFGALDPWAFLRTINPGDATGTRVNNNLNTPRAGLDLVRLGRWHFAMGGRSSTADGAASNASVERARVLGFESRPGVQWARPLVSGSLPPGNYYYQISAVGSEGEGLASREVSVILADGGGVQLQWEDFRDPYGSGGASSFAIFRSPETLGRPSTTRRISFMSQPSPVSCLLPNGTDTGVVACHRFTDNGTGTLLVTPSILSVQTAAGAILAGTYLYRLAAYNGSGVAAAGYEETVVLTVSSNVTLSWQHNGQATGYYLYRNSTCLREVIPPGGTVNGETLSYTDDNTGSCAQALPNPNRPLPRGSLSKWQTLPSQYNLLTPREGHRALAMSLDIPDVCSASTCQSNGAPCLVPADCPAQGQRHFIFAVGGRDQAPAGTSFNYLDTTERVEVNIGNGSFVQVSDYGSPVRYWDYERTDLANPGDCDGTPPDNCIRMNATRAYHAITTNLNRFENEQPNVGCTECCIPDRDGDGFNAIACGGQDCNDDDDSIYPGAPEDCDDGIDSNCDGCPGPSSPCAASCPGAGCGACELQNCCDCNDADYLDYDRDGFMAEECCFFFGDVCTDSPSYQYNLKIDCDCNDRDGTVFPGAAEACEDGVVKDCTICSLTGPNCNAGGAGGLDDTCSGPCSACDEAAECRYGCSAADDPACGGGCGSVDPDFDNDGYADAAYAGHPTLGTCCGATWGMPCTDCNDGNAGINPGASDICGNGIAEDCVADQACSCGDQDGDLYLSAGIGEGCGEDCIDDWAAYCTLYGSLQVCDNGKQCNVEQDCINQFSANCAIVYAVCPTDGSAPASPRVGFRPEDINPGITGDDPFGSWCGDGIDNDCNGVSPSCAAGYTFPSKRGSTLLEPVFLFAHQGVSSYSGSADTGGAADDSEEAALVENELASSLGHIVHVTSCDGTVDEGKVYKDPTCGVAGWEIEPNIYGMSDRLYGQETLVYYDFLYPFGGATTSNQNTGATAKRFDMCIVPGQHIDAGSACIGIAADAWDMDTHLFGIVANQGQSTNSNMQMGHAFFAMERIFSYLFAIGGVSGNGWTITDTVVRNSQ